MKIFKSGVFIMIVFLLFSCAGQKQNNAKVRSDNGDGTYTNPVIPGDHDCNILSGILMHLLPSRPKLFIFI